MNAKSTLTALVLGLGLTLSVFLWVDWSLASVHAQAEAPPAPQPARLAGLDPTSPITPVRLIFIHHSTGENWLAGDNGRLGIALRDHNYFVSDTNYGWVGGGTDVGNRTDIGNWWEWFAGPNRNNITRDLYAESGQHSYYSRLADNPGGENQIIVFKSCFPNSNLGGSPDDPPTTGNNPLRGKDSGSEYHTVANAKGIYNDILTYFATRQDKLFIVITAPPLVQGETTLEQAANARAFNTWLVNDWLKDYPYNNVVVFDFYNVLTSNGGDRNTNDLNWDTGNYHRHRNGVIEYVTGAGSNVAAYGTDDYDSHPTQAGNLKATGEFVPLLNIYYHRWLEGASQKNISAWLPEQGQTVTFSSSMISIA